MGTIQKWHLGIGLAALAFFAGTGQYLHFRQPAMESTELGPRMVLRAGHIYLLFSGLLNVVAGFRYEHIAGKLSRLGSILMLASPVLLAAGFCIEATRNAVERHLTRAGVFAAVIGVVLQFIAFLAYRRKQA
jgi:FtsH-binding integral membrane protein